MKITSLNYERRKLGGEMQHVFNFCFNHSLLFGAYRWYSDGSFGIAKYLWIFRSFLFWLGLWLCLWRNRYFNHGSNCSYRCEKCKYSCLGHHIDNCWTYWRRNRRVVSSSRRNIWSDYYAIKKSITQSVYTTPFQFFWTL